MRDESVPARWRLLGLIKGFHVNGKAFYASNNWIMEELGCSEPTVVSAVAELEKLGKIRCERTRRSRVIYPVLDQKIISETQVDQGLRLKSTLVSDLNQLKTNSDSNSDSNIGATREKQTFEEFMEDRGYYQYEYPTSEDGVITSWGKSPSSKVSDGVLRSLQREYSRLSGVAQSETRPPKVVSEINQVFYLFKKLNPAYETWYRNKTQRAAAEFLLSKSDVAGIERVINIYLKHKDKPFCPQIDSPDSLVKKMAKLIDFHEKNSGGNLKPIKYRF